MAINNYVGRPGITQTLALPASGTTPVASTAFNANTLVVRVVSPVPCWVSFGSATTATTGLYLPANSPEYFYIDGQNTLSIIGVVPAASTTATVTEMSN